MQCFYSIFTFELSPFSTHVVIYQSTHYSGSRLITVALMLMFAVCCFVSLYCIQIIYNNTPWVYKVIYYYVDVPSCIISQGSELLFYLATLVFLGCCCNCCHGDVTGLS